MKLFHKVAITICWWNWHQHFYHFFPIKKMFNCLLAEYVEELSVTMSQYWSAYYAKPKPKKLRKTGKTFLRRAFNLRHKSCSKTVGEIDTWKCRILRLVQTRLMYLIRSSFCWWSEISSKVSWKQTNCNFKKLNHFMANNNIFGIYKTV